MEVFQDRSAEAGPPHYPFSAPPAPGGSVEVASGIHWLRMPLPFALDHINIWLLEGGDGWTLVDTGAAVPGMEDVWNGHADGILAGAGLSRLVVTHYHPDHLGMAAWLSDRFAARVTMTEAEFLTAHLVHSSRGTWSGDTLARHFESHGLDEERCRLIAERPNGYCKLVPALPPDFDPVQDGDRIRLGHHDWLVIVTKGHAPEHACLYCEDLGVLIAGDQLLPKITSNVAVWPAKPESDPLHQYLDSLSSLARLPADTLVLPSHGLPFTGVRERIAAVRDHHRERLATLAEACVEPRTAAESLPVLFRRKLDMHGIFFAMGEAIAHLNHLWFRGELERRRTGDGVFRFQRPQPVTVIDGGLQTSSNEVGQQ